MGNVVFSTANSAVKNILLFKKKEKYKTTHLKILII